MKNIQNKICICCIHAVPGIKNSQSNNDKKRILMRIETSLRKSLFFFKYLCRFLFLLFFIIIFQRKKKINYIHFFVQSIIESILQVKLFHFSVRQYTAFKGDFEIIFFSKNQKSCISESLLESILGLIISRFFSISVYDIHHSLIDFMIKSTHFFEIKLKRPLIGQ